MFHISIHHCNSTYVTENKGWVLTCHYNQASFYYHCFEPVTIQNYGFDYNIEGDEFLPLVSTFQKNLCYTGASPRQTNEDRSVIKAGRRKEDSKPDARGANKHTDLEMSALMSNKRVN